MDEAADQVIRSRGLEESGLVREESTGFRTDQGSPGGSAATDPAAARTAAREVTDFQDSSPVDDDQQRELEEGRARIAETRRQLSSTIDEIQERLNPQHLVQQAKDTVREATIGRVEDVVNDVGDRARGAGLTMLDTIKENPVPAALAGIGLAWLYMNAQKKSSQNQRFYGRRYEYDYPPGYGRSYGYGYTRYSAPEPQGVVDRARDRISDAAGQVQDKAGQVAGAVQDKAGQVAGAVQDRAGQVVDQVQQTAGQMVDQVQQTAGQVADTAQYQAQRVATGFQQMLTDNPMVVGALALAVGAAIGLAVPETPQEHQLMGEAKDKLAGMVQEKAQDLAEKVQHVAQAAQGAAGSLKDAAGSVKDAATQEAKTQGLTA